MGILRKCGGKWIKESDEYIKLRSNVSVVSTGLQYGLDSINLLEALFHSFNTNVNSLGRDEQSLYQYDSVSKFYFEDKDVFKFVVDVLKKSDTGIHDIKIIKDKDEETGKDFYFPVFSFKVNGEIRRLTYYDQSSGTQSLFLQLGNYSLALLLGNTLALDEFDINLHPDLLPMLVDFFDNPKKNLNNAQLIFSTHNTEIMDKLGKYRVVLVNKQDNESFLYRLDEIPGDMLRNDRPIAPVYKAGKIGGKPKLTA
jgi:uncharacterized protein